MKAITRIADHLDAHRPGHPLRVAVDGITAAGKTTLAQNLTTAILATGRPAIHLSVDNFHHQRAYRHRQVHDLARGYYEDAYDFDTFARVVLRSLAKDGTFQRRSHDLETDALVNAPTETASPDTVVVVDGSFLQRPELAPLWDEIIFVDTPFDLARARGSARDSRLFGGIPAAEAAFDTRYHAANRIYLNAMNPRAHATIVVREGVLQRIGGTETTDTTDTNLFSHGTLQHPEVQLSQFGRKLDGSPDELPGGTPGTIFRITTTELAATDTHEADDHRRVLINLTSGTQAWTYIPR